MMDFGDKELKQFGLLKHKLLSQLLGVGLLFLASCEAISTEELNTMIPNRSIPVAAANNVNLEQLQQSVFQQVNEYRVSQNISPLTLDPTISQPSKQHSQNMATGKVPFSHNGAKQRFDKIANQISYQKIAENVGYNSGYNNPAEQVVQGWIKSDGHRENILGDYNLTGIGIAKNDKGEYYFTQIFVRSR
ncbi:MAG: CAP domain-containing protein [Microcoleaceae cyanobacterium]